MIDLQNVQTDFKSSTDIKGIDIPVLRSFVVLRREYFGGFLFNPYFPPASVMDRIRFQVATLCNGTNTITDIGNQILQDFDHSIDYIDDLVRLTVHSMDKNQVLFWQKSKTHDSRDFGFMGQHEIPTNGNRYLSTPTNVIWEITSACNLRCSQCYASSNKALTNELNTEEAKRLIDIFHDWKVFTLTLSGGEPLMRPDIFELLDHISKKNFNTQILSNGTLITDDIICRLKDTSVDRVQVSIDGLEKTHDSLRGMNGAFKSTVRALSPLIDAGFEVCVSITANKKNINEILDLVNYVGSIGVEIFKVGVFMPYGRGEDNKALSLTPQDMKRLSNIINTRRKELEESVIQINNKDFYPWLTKKRFGNDSNSIRINEDKKVACAVGNTTMYILPDGKATPCNYLRHLIIGDLTQIDPWEIWNNSELLQRFRNIKQSHLNGQCNNCEFLGNGCDDAGCRARALACTGDLFNSSPLCWKHLRD
ncbi:radical SAM/SPASM domain-containing protein [Bacteroidota bacterium]